MGDEIRAREDGRQKYRTQAESADGNAELHAKRIAKRGKVQFAVPRISDEVCQLQGKKEPSQAKKLTSH